MVKPTRVTNDIRTLRFRHGEMTQAELAQRLGVTRQTVIAIEVVSPSETHRPDVRDKQIDRAGEQVGNSLVVIASLGALVLAMLQVHWFWIANAIYLGFVLSAVLASLAKLAMYRRGVPAW